MPRRKKSKATALVPVEQGGAVATLEPTIEPDAPPAAGEPIDAEFTVKPASPPAAADNGDHELLSRICRAEQDVQAKEKVLEERKEDAKAAKDEYDESVLRLRHLIQSLEDDADSMPLFNGQANGTPKPSTPADESWRQVPLTEALLGIKPAVLEKLKASDLNTVGQLQEFINRLSENGLGDPLTTIKGIGPETATKIADALAEFWRRRQTVPPPAEAETQPVGKCKVCGCVDENCEGCVERTGRPCSWVSSSEDLCTACTDIWETELSTVGDSKLTNLLIEAMKKHDITTVGQVLAMDVASVPNAAAVIAAVRRWVKKQLKKKGQADE